MTYARLFENKSCYKERRSRLRFRATKAEQVLWYELRQKKLAYKFRRQFGIDGCIVDFCCYPLRLVIELDGPIHDNDYNRYKDRRRDGWLRKRGYVVLRFSNDDVIFHRREEILQIIKSWCKKLERRSEDKRWNVQT